MAKQTTYTQCTMKRRTASGSSEITSYIPQQFAKQGRVLRLRDEDGDWTDGWIVEGVGSTMIAQDELPDYRKAIRNHRKRTGDSTRRSKNKE